MNGEDKIYSLIKNFCDGRVYPEVAEQNTELPYIVYKLAGTENFVSMCNVVHGSRAEMNIIVVSETIKEARSISSDIVSEMAGEASIENIYNDVDTETGIVQRVVSVTILND